MQPQPNRMPSIRMHARIKAAYGLAMAGLALALLLLTHHAPRRVIEAELAIPAVLLLYGGGSVGALERKAAETIPLAPLIAIVGCDGSGKSTLSAHMHALLAKDRAIDRCYLGLGSGELGNRIRELPLIGPAVEGLFARKASQSRARDKVIPGLLTALVIFGFSLLRLRRFRRMLALRRQGVAVITDRYPQTDVAGFYDGPGLSAARAGSSAVAWLAVRERRLYEWMAGFKPDIVLRLNVDADTALLRKPDHKPDLLRAKVAATPLLRFQGARIVDIDARASAGEVLRTALGLIEPVLSRADRTGKSVR